MNKNIKLVLILIAVIIVIGAIWSWKSQGSAPAPQKESGPITIGYIGPLTGPSAVLGMDAAKAVEIAVKEANDKGGVNGREVKLVIEDDQYLSAKTISAYEKMVSLDKAKIILVATYGGVFAVADRAQKDGIIIIDPLDCNKDVAMAKKNVFCIATETESIAYALADNLISQGKNKAGVMFSTKDNFMSLVKDAFEKRMEEKGGTVIVDNYSYTDTDFKTSLLKIKAENPQALVILGHDEQGIIMKQARDLGLKVPFLTTGTITSPGAQSAAKGAAEGTVFAFWGPDQDNTASKTLIDKFSQLVGRPPIFPLTTHPAYDTIKILTDKILPAVADNMTANAINKELLQVQNYKGVSGNISIQKDGGARIIESAWKLVDGQPVKI